MQYVPVRSSRAGSLVIERQRRKHLEPRACLFHRWPCFLLHVPTADYCTVLPLSTTMTMPVSTAIMLCSLMPVLRSLR